MNTKEKYITYLSILSYLFIIILKLAKCDGNNIGQGTTINFGTPLNNAATHNEDINLVLIRLYHAFNSSKQRKSVSIFYSFYLT